MIKNLIIAFFIFSTFLFSQNIEFIGEELHFNLDEKTFSVVGDYYFFNPADETVNRLLIYPFPEDSCFSTPYDVSAIQSEDNVMLSDSISAKGFYFSVEIEPQDTSICNIKYRQDLKANHAVYLLRSTRTWKKPLNFAEFTLITPPDMIIDSLSYQADSISVGNETKVYYFENKDFWPVKDFYVRFKSD